MSTTPELQARLRHLKGVDPREIGCRAGEASALIEEVLMRRAQVAMENIKEEERNRSLVYRLARKLALIP